MLRQVSFVSAVMLAAVSAQPFFPVPTGIGINLISSMRMASSSFSTAKSSMVHACINGIKASTNMTASLASRIPVIGTYAKLGATVANSKADSINNLAQAKIQSLQALLNNKFDKMEKLLNMTGSGVQLSPNMTGAVSTGTIGTSLPNMTKSRTAGLNESDTGTINSFGSLFNIFTG